MSFGRKIQKLRVMYGYTQEQVSNHLHVTRTCYSNYENEKRTPAYSVIVLLADYYHVSVDYLIRDDYEELPIIYTKETDRLIRNLKKKENNS